MQLGKHVARSQAVAREQDQAVEPQVRGFPHEMQAIAALRREHRLGCFLAYFLQHRILAFGELTVKQVKEHMKSRGIEVRL